MAGIFAKHSKTLRPTPIKHRDELYDAIFDTIIMGKVKETGGREAIRVQLLGKQYTDSDPITVRLLYPYISSKDRTYLGTDVKNFEDTQTTSGFIVPTPEIGTLGLVALANKNATEGFWLGGIMPPEIGKTIPDFATDSNIAAEKKDLDEYASSVGLPASEKILSTDDGTVDPTKIKRAIHPFADILKKQGLLVDTVRGQSSSSFLRDRKTRMLGFNTPGEVADREDLVDTIINNKTEKRPKKITNKGGHTFTMDDGDVFGANNLTRIRSSKGAQILLHDTEEIVYIANQSGSAWIEMTADGKIDVYAKDSVSIHSEKDFNFRADRDINFEAGRNLNLKGTERTYVEATDLRLLGKVNGRLEVRGPFDVSVDTYRTSASDYNLSTNNLDISNKLNTRIRTGEIDLVSQFGQRYSAGTGVEFKTNVLENQIWNKVTYNAKRTYYKGTTVVFGTQFFKALKQTTLPASNNAPAPPAPGPYWELVPPVIPKTVHGDFKIDTNIAGPLPAQFQVNSKSHIKLSSIEGKVELKALADTIDIQSSANVYVDGAQVHLNLPGPGALPATPIAISALQIPSIDAKIPYDTGAEMPYNVPALGVFANPKTDDSLEWKEGYYAADTPLISIMKRIPMHEPWAGHEGLDKEQTSSAKTDIEISGK
jgi:hypothetical protein